VIGNKPSKLQRCFNFKVGQHFTKSFTATGNAVVTATYTATGTLTVTLGFYEKTLIFQTSNFEILI
jgi:hypothetical protein